MKRLIVAAASAAVLAFAAVAPASAHLLVVNPGGSEPSVKWVGGPALPGQGKGLIPGGPTGSYLQTPAHGGGLSTACEKIRAHGNGTVDIFGPPTPAGCPHGT